MDVSGTNILVINPLYIEPSMITIYVNIFWKLTLSRRRRISYRNLSIDLLCKSMDWFLYDIGLSREKVKQTFLAREQNLFY